MRGLVVFALFLLLATVVYGQNSSSSSTGVSNSASSSVNISSSSTGPASNVSSSGVANISNSSSTAVYNASSSSTAVTVSPSSTAVSSSSSSSSSSNNATLPAAAESTDTAWYKLDYGVRIVIVLAAVIVGCLALMYMVIKIGAFCGAQSKLAGFRARYSKV